MNEIVVSDEYNKIREEIKLLMQEMAALLMERDELLYHICPELRAKYAKEIGDYQARAMYQELMILELKRRIEITRAALNREQVISEEEVDEQVKEEYKEFHKKVDEEYKKTENAKEEYKSKEEKTKEYRKQWEEKYGDRYDDTTDETGGSSDSNEKEDNDAVSKKKKPPTLKELYRKIVKKLHPDVNSNATEREKELLNKACAAYEEGDMVTLQEIYDEIFGDSKTEDILSDDNISIEQLIKLKLQMALRIKELLAEVEAIMADFPYNQKNFLDDPEALKEEQDKIKAKIERYEQEIQRLTKILEEVNKQLEELREKKRRRSNGRKRKI